MANADVRVKITSPESARRGILSAARDSAMLLQNFSAPAKIRRQKQILRKKLAGNLKEIKALIKQFDSTLPALSDEFRKKEDRAPHSRQAVHSGKPSTLQQELEEIERKLKELQ